jgi:amino acid adenylation domain-containing protein
MEGEMQTGLEGRSLFERILETAEAHPAAVAVRDGAAVLTYGELLGRAARLGSALCALGVRSEHPVGLCLPRSIDHVVAVLGVLRTGAALLPLAPDWPTDRLRGVLADAGAAVAIVPQHRAADLAGDSLELLIQGQDSVVDPAPATPGIAEQLAYIVYTSGSTGKPKGVEISHRGLANLVDWHLSAFAVGPRDSVSCLSGLTFDALVWELVPALVAGATICLAPDEVRVEPRLLQDWLLREDVTVAFVPTPVAEPLIDAEWPADTRLRILLTGGDVLHVWPRPGLPFRVINNYGPSECTVVATSGVIEPGGKGLPPIGQAIANSRVHLVDEAGKAVRSGAIGEIWVSGANLGRGYRGDPWLTAERFVNRGSERFYRTGDLARLRPDGSLDFQGRRDDQLKIRGYRIEPDEVSAALDRHPDVQQSVVVGRGVGGDRQLIAYVVPRDGLLLRAAELRELLRLSLPAYMVPDLFMRLTSIPLTPNGKPDRAALPPPSPLLILPDQPYRAPVTPTEVRVAEMVQEVLTIDRVGADDNFFLLGGHSLLGTQLLLRLRQAFGADLSLRDLFEARTVARIAGRIEQLVTEMVRAMDTGEVAGRLAS